MTTYTATVETWDDDTVFLTIPAEVFERLGWIEDDEVRITVYDDGVLEITKPSPQDDA